MKSHVDTAYREYAELRLSGKHGVASSFFLIYPFLRHKKVLDIGCSDGLYLESFGEGSVGIEQIPELVSKARVSGLNVILGQVPEVLCKIDSGSFPSVFFSHVMEHLENPISSLRQINRVLEPGGHLILGLPTENNIFRYVLRMNYFNGTHLYSFSVGNAIKLIQICGFEPTEVFYDLPKFKGKLGRMIIRLYQHFPFKEHISMAYWIVAKKPT